VKLIALAGEQYRTAVHDGPWEYEAPMKGLGIGQQLGWLTGKISANQTAAYGAGQAWDPGVTHQGLVQ
jgi:hypothetical protein